jgi:hypothetical protein
MASAAAVITHRTAPHRYQTHLIIVTNPPFLFCF